MRKRAGWSSIVPPGESGSFTATTARELARAIDRCATLADLHDRAASAPALHAVSDPA